MEYCVTRAILSTPPSVYSSVWTEHSVWVRGVGGSNPPTLTNGSIALTVERQFEALCDVGSNPTRSTLGDCIPRWFESITIRHEGVCISLNTAGEQ